MGGLPSPKSRVRSPRDMPTTIRIVMIKTVRLIRVRLELAMPPIQMKIAIQWPMMRMRARIPVRSFPGIQIRMETRMETKVLLKISL